MLASPNDTLFPISLNYKLLTLFNWKRIIHFLSEKAIFIVKFVKEWNNDGCLNPQVFIYTDRTRSIFPRSQIWQIRFSKYLTISIIILPSK